MARRIARIDDELRTFKDPHEVVATVIGHNEHIRARFPCSERDYRGRGVRPAVNGPGLF